MVQASHDVADEAADAVYGEDVETLVNAEKVFVSDCEEGCAGGKGSDQCCCLDRHESASWCDTDETGDNSRTKADDGEFAGEHVF
jgi:hypothetical protein